MNDATYLAPLLEAFFTERLTRQREASPNTVDSYSNAFKLLLAFARKKLKKAPSKLQLVDLDVPFISQFLDHLESARGNSPRTRNARLAAIHSFFNYVAFREPRHSALIQRVLDIPTKRWQTKPVDFLKNNEVEALLQAPDLSTWLGRRDRALMALMAQTGLRVSETIGLRFKDVELDGPAHVRCTGKGRKQRLTPIKPAMAAILRDWSKECKARPEQPLFPNSRDQTHLSRDAVEYLIKKHVKVAQEQRPSFADKRASTQLRHEPAPEWSRSCHDRPLARPRIAGQHSVLPPRRHQDEAEGPGEDGALWLAVGSIPTRRQPYELPRRTQDYAESTQRITTTCRGLGILNRGTRHN